jgi:hypothetical protein
MHRKGAPSWKDFPRRKDEQGRWLCRKCGTALDGRKTSWCGKDCLKAVLLMCDWGTIRRTIRRRDKWMCVLCGNRATEVDHIVELADGGSFFDPSNLRSLCTTCHKAKTMEARRLRALKRKEQNAKV